ncbi:hypothetical protein [Pseudomonas syringae group genomosp. 3]|uniref:Uncharacterized protein n=1 Tax=Pseudomonas syringae pv. coriandricola TaxID=264453 RepID=A0A3M3JSQ4_9PSED|nr:hypothetical protein [Pseudomonas syringae group genomosp. 3]RMN13954.1 hypothetical protein ALQ65_200341 [Pseudomonas syringae pv. coriandricola]
MTEPVHYFMPHKSKEFPFMTEVELLLGGIPQVMFPDGTFQFADQDHSPVVIFSPRLSETDLNEFCRDNIEQYRKHYAAHKEAIDEYETPPITKFWLEE